MDPAQLRRHRTLAVLPRQPDLFAVPEARHRRRDRLGPARARGRPQGRPQAYPDDRQVHLLIHLPEGAKTAMSEKSPQNYWKANLRIIFICMGIWALVSYGFEIGRASCRERVCQYV